MKISLDELFLYRQYLGYPVEFYFDRKKNNIVSKEDVVMISEALNHGFNYISKTANKRKKQ